MNEMISKVPFGGNLGGFGLWYKTKMYKNTIIFLYYKMSSTVNLFYRSKVKNNQFQIKQLRIEQNIF